jgi:hypothetical protein
MNPSLPVAGMKISPGGHWLFGVALVVLEAIAVVVAALAVVLAVAVAVAGAGEVPTEAAGDGVASTVRQPVKSSTIHPRRGAIMTLYGASAPVSQVSSKSEHPEVLALVAGHDAG